MTKKKKTNKMISDLYLDRPTSHGGWPSGKEGGYVDPDTPVYKQIANYLEKMGLAEDNHPRAKLSEVSLKKMIRNVISEMYTLHDDRVRAQPGDIFEKIAYVDGKPKSTGDLVQIIEVGYFPEEQGERSAIGFYIYRDDYDPSLPPDRQPGTTIQSKSRNFHKSYKSI